MPGPLLYRPAPRWQAISAFAGALFIHAAAVGIASIHPKEPPPQDLSQLPEAVELSLEPQQQEPMPTPPPDQQTPPASPPDAIADPAQPDYRQDKKPQPLPPLRSEA